MTNAEILEKAIQKAIIGGWKGWSWPSSFDLLQWRWEDDERVFSDGEWDEYEDMDVEHLIFNHDFAQALWGTNDHTEYYGINASVKRPLFAYHLMQMVIAEDPIKYLGENI